MPYLKEKQENAGIIFQQDWYWLKRIYLINDGAKWALTFF